MRFSHLIPHCLSIKLLWIFIKNFNYTNAIIKHSTLFQLVKNALNECRRIKNLISYDQIFDFLHGLLFDSKHPPIKIINGLIEMYKRIKISYSLDFQCFRNRFLKQVCSAINIYFFYIILAKMIRMQIIF